MMFNVDMQGPFSG